MSGTDLPKISDEMVEAWLLVHDGGTTTRPHRRELVRHALAAALVVSGWKPEAALRPVTWQEPGKLPAAFHQHRCGAVEWWPMEGADSGGCDACESGSDDPRDWRMLYAADWPATALEQAQPLLAAGSEVEPALCGEVGTGFPNGSYADPTYTEPCALPFDHEEDHDWAQREAREAAEGQERSDEQHG